MDEIPNEQWLHEYRDKIEPLMHALYRHLGPERLGDKQIQWSRMRYKDGSELMVATLHEMDYWIDPTTGDLKWEQTVMEEKANEALTKDLNDFISSPATGTR